MKFQAPPGVFDIVPEDPKTPWKASPLWEHVETVMKTLSKNYGYREIRTPIFERTELFLRGVGETTDIVSKEMYTFMDKGERSLTLRPEGTASVVRAALENNLIDAKGQKFFYTGPMFRYERMQAGRFRQFHQFGIEAYGNKSPEQDAEIIDLAFSIFKTLGIKNLKVTLSSLGDKPSREKYREALITYLKNHFDKLSEDSKERLEKNPLRVLDSKDPADKAIVQDAPSLLDFLSEECVEHFEKVKQCLEDLDIPYIVDSRLVRGLDYYQKTVFEIISEDLGAHNTLCGGGRYDGLVEELGGPVTPCTGFGIGIERTLQVMLKQEVYKPAANALLMYLIPMGTAAKREAFKIAHHLRSLGISCEIDLDDRKVGKAFSRASDLGAKFVTVLGDNELSTGEIEIKELSTGNKKSLSLKSLSRILLIEKGSVPFLELYETMTRPFDDVREKDFFLSRIDDSIGATQKITEQLKLAVTSLQDHLE